MDRPAIASAPAWRSLANGVVLAVALAALALVASKVVQSWLNPTGPSPVSPVLCAVLLGVIWRNAIGLDAGFVPGLHWITNNLLRIGIALVGLKLSLSGLASTATLALPVVIASPQPVVADPGARLRDVDRQCRQPRGARQTTAGDAGVSHRFHSACGTAHRG